CAATSPTASGPLGAHITHHVISKPLCDVSPIAANSAGWFASAGHLAAWAGMAPGNNVSAGKRQGGKTRKGSPWLRQTLVEAVHGVGRSKDTYLGAQDRRLSCARARCERLRPWDRASW